MYPDFQYLVSAITGTEAPAWLSLFKVFGFFVAMAFVAAAYILYLELKRKEQQGLLAPKIVKETIGKQATTMDYVWAGIIGFIVLFKVGGLIANASEASGDPLSYVLSMQGNWVTGIIGAIVGVYWRYMDNKKTALPKPIVKNVAIYPHQRISEIVTIAAIGGLAGAKLFNAFETWDDFVRNPINSLISSSGLTFYGGLIVATFALWRFCKRNGINFIHLCDAAAPALILAYGIGRLGCHFAGDGDWGIFNSAYVTNTDGQLQPQARQEFDGTLVRFENYFSRDFNEKKDVPHLYVPAAAGLPRWLFAMNYAHNVNNDGITIPNCKGHYCSVLPVGVFPTPLYEFAMCLIIFGILWGVRRRIKWPLHMFGWYLILSGLERFMIEKIRVNYKYQLGFIDPTQAEIISVLFILCGLGIVLFYKNTKALQPAKPMYADDIQAS